MARSSHRKSTWDSSVDPDVTSAKNVLEQTPMHFRKMAAVVRVALIFRAWISAREVEMIVSSVPVRRGKPITQRMCR